MACACVKEGKPQCAWCREAALMGRPPAQHNCQWYGGCS